MKTEEELIWESYKGKGENMFKTAYHVTYADNVDSIKKYGIKPSKPQDFDEAVDGVYLFPSYDDMEDALVNWLGDRLDEDRDIVAIKLNISGLKCESDVEYELRCLETIEPIRIIDIDYNI